MGNDNVVSFTGLTRLDLEPDTVLQAACGQLATVLVVGFTPDDELYVAASSGDRYLNHYLASVAAHELMVNIEE